MFDFPGLVCWDRVCCDDKLSCIFFFYCPATKEAKMPSRECRTRTILRTSMEKRVRLSENPGVFHTRFQSQNRSATKGTTRIRARIRNL